MTFRRSQARWSAQKGTRLMRYAYIRVSTDKQTIETQRFEILKFADEKKLTIDQ